eukprot:s2604_g8.t2
MLSSMKEHRKETLSFNIEELGWRSPSGNLPWEAIHQVLWAKALASHAMTVPVFASEAAASPAKKARTACNANAPRHGVPRLRRQSRRGGDQWALPEKLLPATGVPVQDPVLQIRCPARAAVLRAWRALHWAAGCREPNVHPWSSSLDYVSRLSAELDGTRSAADLLLEVAVLIFVMGCRLSKPARAKAIALPLAVAAVTRFNGLGPQPDDIASSARHMVEILAPETALTRKMLSLQELPDHQVPQSVLAWETTELKHSHARWRLAGYRARDEVWLLRRGRRRLAALAAPAPLTWCLEADGNTMRSQRHRIAALSLCRAGRPARALGELQDLGRLLANIPGSLADLLREDVQVLQLEVEVAVDVRGLDSHSSCAAALALLVLKNCQARNRLCRFIVPPIECAHGMAADATKFISPAKILLMDKTLAVVMVIILWLAAVAAVLFTAWMYADRALLFWTVLLSLAAFRHFWWRDTAVQPVPSGAEQRNCASSGRPPQGNEELDAARRAGVPAEHLEQVAELGRRVSARGQMEPLCDPLMLLRFLKARDFDVSAAAVMYRATIKWRATFSIQSVMMIFGTGETYTLDGNRAAEDPTSWRWHPELHSREASLVKKYGFFGRLSQRSAGGEPVAIWRLGAADLDGYVREDTSNQCGCMDNVWTRRIKACSKSYSICAWEDLVSIITRGFVSHLEDLLQCGRAESLRRKQLVQARLLIDAKGLGSQALRHRAVIRKMISTGKNNFPEVNFSVTIIRAPFVFAKLWGLAKSHLTPAMPRPRPTPAFLSPH